MFAVVAQIRRLIDLKFGVIMDDDDPMIPELQRQFQLAKTTERRHPSRTCSLPAAEVPAIAASLPIRVQRTHMLVVHHECVVAWGATPPGAH